ncbi:hypothetical protein GF318_00995 [Candidatus Micrarchaeota archaeon]|nr:hypothetical protein [Candidatus Micrarchaeota archaeon]
MEFVNEFGQRITEKELKELTERIQRLEDRGIDELWYRCGFVMKDKEKEYRALRQFDMDRLRSGLDTAKKVVLGLFLETKVKEIEENLENIESQAT